MAVHDNTEYSPFHMHKLGSKVKHCTGIATARHIFTNLQTLVLLALQLYT